MPDIFVENRMELKGISFGNAHPLEPQDLGEFIESNQAKTPLGMLLIALVGEETWSTEYEVYACLKAANAYLQISHPTFLPDRSLVVHNDPKTEWSISRVEAVLREHLRSSKETIESSISILQEKATNIHAELNRIDWNKAKAVLTTAFPATANAERVSCNAGEFYVFALRELQDQLFVTRKIGDWFVGGSARNISRTGWNVAKYGKNPGQQHHMFWVALARAFAAADLEIPEDDLICETVAATDKMFGCEDPDQYVVEKVILAIRGGGAITRRGGVVTVTFNDNNVPSSVYVSGVHPKE